MITQSKKKIYIIGSNPNDFFDLTIEAINILSKSNVNFLLVDGDKISVNDINKPSNIIVLNKFY